LCVFSVDHVTHYMGVDVNASEPVDYTFSWIILSIVILMKL